MGFDAGTIVEPLNWTFVKVTKDEADQGTIAEPSDKAIKKLFRELAKLNTELVTNLGLDPKVATVPQVLQALGDIPDDATEELSLDTHLRKLTELFAELCSGSPSVEQLEKLPLRIRIPFFNWLREELRPNVFGNVTPNPGQANGRPPALTLPTTS